MRVQKNLCLASERRLRARLNARVKGCAEAIAAAAREAIVGGSRTGEVRGGHQASAPGEPPASQTGTLESSVFAATAGGEGATRAEVGVRAAYAPDLEFGTASMAPRLFLLPAAEAAFRELREGLAVDLKEMT